MSQPTIGGGPFLCLTGLVLCIGWRSTGFAAGVQPATRPAERHPDWLAGQSVGYVVSIEEKRVSSDAGQNLRSELALKRMLHLRLEPAERKADGRGPLRVRIERLELTGLLDGRPIAYDSRRDQKGQGNPVADLLSTVIGVSFEVQRGPDGRFIRVRGLDSAWMAARQMLPSPPLLSIQSSLRDPAMLGLLSDAISPPLPEDLGKPGLMYQRSLPAELPGVTPLKWAATSTTGRPEVVQGLECTRIIAQGPLAVVRPAGDVGDSGLRSEVVEGHRRSDLHVDGVTGQVVRQEAGQRLVLDVMLKAPAGGDAPRMRITQETQVLVTRQLEQK